MENQEMNYQEMINMKVKCISEQIQEDLITLLEDKFGPYDDIKEEVTSAACQIVVEHLKTLMVSFQSDTQVRLVCNNSLTDSESKLLSIRHHKRQTEVLEVDNSKFSKKTTHKSE
jgi:hypothetical protein